MPHAAGNHVVVLLLKFAGSKNNYFRFSESVKFDFEKNLSVFIFKATDTHNVLSSKAETSRNRRRALPGVDLAA